MAKKQEKKEEQKEIDLIAGKRYMLDAKFKKRKIVIVTKVGRMICDVKDPDKGDVGGVWPVMKNRLSEIKEK